MAYADTYDCASDATIFQKRVYVAVWLVAQDIASTPPANTTIARTDWAQKVMSDKMNISPRQLAFQILRDPTVVAALNTATDAQILSAVLARLNDLVSIG